MTLGWDSPNMVLLRSSRDEVWCPCGDVLEKLSNKTSGRNMPVVLEDPVFLKGRWAHDFSCCHSQKKEFSEYCGQLLGTIHHAASLAESSVWAKACSLLGLWAAAGVAMWLCRGWLKCAHRHQKFNSV